MTIGTHLYIPMATTFAPLLCCYGRDFTLSLSDNNQADIIEVFDSASRYLYDLLLSETNG